MENDTGLQSSICVWSLHPNKIIFTWCRRLPFQQARLDYFIGSHTLIKLVGNCDILLAYRTDHFLIILKVLINIFKHEKGV